jgi:hypothetical protein
MEPYNTPNLYRTELYSILSAGVTLYCGFYYKVYSVSYEWGIMLFICILAANVLFLSFWIHGVFGAVYLWV